MDLSLHLYFGGEVRAESPKALNVKPARNPELTAS